MDVGVRFLSKCVGYAGISVVTVLGARETRLVRSAGILSADELLFMLDL